MRPAEARVIALCPLLRVNVLVEEEEEAADDALHVLEQSSPQNRLVTAEEVAALALLLASEDGRGINGQGINVDGGTVLF